jgi:DNA repair protein RAD5
MNGLELGETNVRDQSMHPLWEEYTFKKEPVHGAPIEIDEDEDEVRNVFYFK